MSEWAWSHLFSVSWRILPLIQQNILIPKVMKKEYYEHLDKPLDDIPEENCNKWKRHDICFVPYFGNLLSQVSWWILEPSKPILPSGRKPKVLFPMAIKGPMIQPKSWLFLNNLIMTWFLIFQETGWRLTAKLDNL